MAEHDNPPLMKRTTRYLFLVNDSGPFSKNLRLQWACGPSNNLDMTTRSTSYFYRHRGRKVGIRGRRTSYYIAAEEENRERRAPNGGHRCCHSDTNRGQLHAAHQQSNYPVGSFGGHWVLLLALMVRLRPRGFLRGLIARIRIRES